MLARMNYGGLGRFGIEGKCELIDLSFKIRDRAENGLRIDGTFCRPRTLSK
jgi:hypothetical protein